VFFHHRFVGYLVIDGMSAYKPAIISMSALLKASIYFCTISLSFH